MSKYSMAMESNPPALVVNYRRGETHEQDQYQWGIRGKIPIAQLVGYVTRVQAELAFRNPESCDECACVVTFDPNTHKLQWFVDSSIPVDALVGTLEMVKQMLVSSQLAQIQQAMQQAQQTGLIGPNGQPILKGK